MFKILKPGNTTSKIVQQAGPQLSETQKMVQEQIKSLQSFAATEIPQMKANQEQLVASLEKLSQTAKALIKK